MKQLILLGVFFFATSAAYAGTCIEFDCRDVYIDSLEISPEGHVRVDTSGNEWGLYCTAPHLFLSKNYEAADKIYAALLAAQVAGKKVKILWVDLTLEGISDHADRCAIKEVELDR